MVVGFNLCRNGVAFFKIDEACVVFKYGQAPRQIEFVCYFGYVCFEETFNLALLCGYVSFEGFVVAVFRPCLADGLKLHISGVSFLSAKISLDRFHFVQV